MNTAMERRLFSVEEYHRMVEVGILGSNDRIELVDGELVTMAPIGKWPEFWILDREHRALEIHREPGAKGYRITLRPDASESIAPAAVPGLVINVGDLFVGLD
ncbi:MAG: hypothetical protein ACKVQU_34455 [Burkholderiales bacterium]